MGVVTLVESIEKLFDECPDKRKRQEYKEWKDTINKLIEEVNHLSKIKMYNTVR